MSTSATKGGAGAGAAGSAASAAASARGDAVPQYGAPAYDLSAYAAAYSGHGRVSRLRFIGEHCRELSARAYALCLEELRKTINTAQYAEVSKLAGTQVDTEWAVAVDRRATVAQERLELDLNGYKTNMQRDKVLEAQFQLGDHLYERGDLNGALKSYVRAREYCPPTELANMCLRVVRVSLELGNPAHAASYIARAEAGEGVVLDTVMTAKFNVANGLALLASRKYAAAAYKFMSVDPALGSSFSEFVTLADVALYAVLCALATFDRSEIRAKIVDATGSFSEVLSAAPDVREMAVAFYNSQYARCFELVDRLRNQVLLDVHLNPHAHKLLADVRRRAIVQYFTPYDTVQMASMAAAFNTSVEHLEQEVASLIMDGHISARIDSNAKLLFARKSDLRDSAFDAVLRAGSTFAEESVDMLRRMDMLRYDIFVRPPPRPSGGMGGLMSIMSMLGAR